MACFWSTLLLITLVRLASSRVRLTSFLSPSDFVFLESETDSKTGPRLLVEQFETVLPLDRFTRLQSLRFC